MLIKDRNVSPNKYRSSLLTYPVSTSGGLSSGFALTRGPYQRCNSRCSKQEVIVIPSVTGDQRAKRNTNSRVFSELSASGEPEAGDVIDLGAPRSVRSPHASAPAAPSARLYPGPRPGPAAKRGNKSAEAERRPRRPRRPRRRKFRKPVPNSRLYRAPPAPAPAPAPAAPSAWPAPAPARHLATASELVLQLAGQREQLAVRIPPADMAAAAAAADDAASAPSEFLAEFLSAIMRRQYAEALKYCQLILQYEPQNATARGFYPILEHKLRRGRTAAGDEQKVESASSDGSAACSGSEERSAAASKSQEQEQEPEPEPEPEDMEQEEDSLSSAGSESEREGSSSLALASSLEEESRAPAWSGSSASASGSGSGSGASSGDYSRCDLDDYHNGNREHALSSDDREDDLENDNASPTLLPRNLQKESARQLQQLRAQFTCSIK